MPDSIPPPLIVAVIGSRTFNDYSLLSRELDQLALTTPIASLVSGGAIGVDALAERYGLENSLPIKIFKPDYVRYGRRAPLVRNVEIVKLSDIIFCLWNGKSKGSAHTLKQARLLGKPTIVVVVPEAPS
jgi:predicted Rossmann fold nucleotide-binding protein DprA/Smf involved in DNA uptake